MDQLKILYICYGYGIAGAESYLLNLIDGFKMHRQIDIWCIVFHDRAFKKKLESSNIDVVSISNLSILKSIFFVSNYIKEKNINIVHCIDIKSTLVGGVAALLSGKAKSVVTIHGLPEFYKSFLMQLKYCISLFIYYLLIRFSINRIIVVSQDLALRMKKLIGIRKVEIIRNGLRLERLESGPLTPNDQLIVGTVGRLNKVKGHRFLLEAAREVLNARNGVVFDVVGDGPLKDELEKLAKNLGISEQVKFWGFRDDAQAIIGTMDVFVLPSLHEGIPYALLEAMALSKAVVCSNVGGIREVISDGKDGVVVPPGDAQTLGGAILNLLSDLNYAKILGRNARKKVEHEYSVDLMVKRTMRLYCNLMAKRGSNENSRS